MRISSITPVVLAFGLLAVLACGREQTIETAEGTATLDQEENTITFSAKGEKGFEMQAGEGARVPENFPRDIPLYPDSKVVASMSSQEGVMVSSQSPAKTTEVVAFYKEKFSGEGWEVQAEMTMGPQRMVSFAKEDREVTLTTVSDGGQTQISILASQ